MSPRYYEIARLQPGRNAAIDAMALSVDLDASSGDDIVCSDSDLQLKRKEGDLLYVSGGGSVVVGGRYLLVVEREARARIHPGKFSLFTGRSDNLNERENPPLLARELFEELLLFRSGRLVWPLNLEYQNLIDRTYAGMGLERSNASAIPFKTLPLPTRPLTVTSGGKVRRFDLTWHIGSTGEINVLQLFSADLPLEGLSARDGEGLDRNIWAYDMESSRALRMTGTSGPADQRKLSPADMTEHLALVLNGLAETGTNAARTA